MQSNNKTEKIELENGQFIYKTTVSDWNEWDKENNIEILEKIEEDLKENE